MGLRDVLVRIRGEEDVSKAANKAGSSLKSLGTQAKKLLENQLVQGIGFAGLLAGLGKAVQASNEFEASTRKLDGTAKITGVSLEALQQISLRAQAMFSLNATLANDFAVELTKLAVKAGDVGKASTGLEAFLNLGAAKGLSAAQTLTAVQQSILGIDEGTDKLFGKNPSVLYAEYAAVIGTTAGKLDDQQKAQALLNAAITDGGKVGGSYLDYLTSAAGKQEQLTNQLQASAAALGAALTPALLAVLPGLTSLSNGIAAFVGGIQLLAVDAAYFFEQIPNTVVLIKGKTLEQLGLLLKGAGDFIPFFGDKVSALGDTLVVEGRRQVKQSQDYTKILLQVKEEQELEIVGLTKTSGAAQVAAVTTSQTKVTTVSAEELKKRAAEEEKQAKALSDARDKWNKETRKQLEDLGKWLGKENKKQADDARGVAELLATELQVNLGEATARALGLTTDAMQRLLEQLRGRIPLEQWQALNAAVQQHKRDLSDLLPPADQLAESAKEAAEANKRMGAELAGAKPNAVQVASNAATLARGFLDAAQAAGVLDSNLASALTSVINIATSLPQALAGDASSLVAVVGGLANIITGLKDNPAEKLRRDVLNKNSDAIARLTREVGNFNLGTTGRTFQGLTDVFGAFGGRADTLSQGSTATRQAGALVLQRDLIKALASKGLSQKDAQAFFDSIGAGDLGKIFTTKDSSLILALIPQIIAALGQTEFGQFGANFEDQLQAVTEGFGILGTTDDDNKLQEFQKLAGQFSPALAEALNVDLSTAEGRAQATKNIQDLFNKLKSGGLSAADIGVSGPQFLALLNTIVPLLAGANGVLQSGLPTTGPQTTGTGSGLPLGAPGLPTSTFGIGAPNITGNIVPAPNSITTVNGGITITNVFPNATNADEISERIVQSVDEALVRRYDNLLAARGQLAQVAS